jgi:hypothetical protein
LAVEEDIRAASGYVKKGNKIHGFEAKIEIKL